MYLFPFNSCFNSLISKDLVCVFRFFDAVAILKKYKEDRLLKLIFQQIFSFLFVTIPILDQTVRLREGAYFYI